MMTYAETRKSQERRNEETRTIGYSNDENKAYNNDDSEISNVIKELAESVAFLSESLDRLSVKLAPVLKLDNPCVDLQECGRNPVLQSPLAIQINSINNHLTESAIKRVQTILFDLAL